MVVQFLSVANKSDYLVTPRARSHSRPPSPSQSPSPTRSLSSSPTSPTRPRARLRKQPRAEQEEKHCHLECICRLCARLKSPKRDDSELYSCQSRGTLGGFWSPPETDLEMGNQTVGVANILELDGMLRRASQNYRPSEIEINFDVGTEEQAWPSIDDEASSSDWIITAQKDQHLRLPVERSRSSSVYSGDQSHDAVELPSSHQRQHVSSPTPPDSPSSEYHAKQYQALIIPLPDSRQPSPSSTNPKPDPQISPISPSIKANPLGIKAQAPTIPSTAQLSQALPTKNADRITVTVMPLPSTSPIQASTPKPLRKVRPHASLRTLASSTTPTPIISSPPLPHIIPISSPQTISPRLSTSSTLVDAPTIPATSPISPLEEAYILSPLTYQPERRTGDGNRDRRIQTHIRSRSHGQLTTGPPPTPRVLQGPFPRRPSSASQSHSSRPQDISTETRTEAEAETETETVTPKWVEIPATESLQLSLTLLTSSLSTSLLRQHERHCNVAPFCAAESNIIHHAHETAQHHQQRPHESNIRNTNKRSRPPSPPKRISLHDLKVLIHAYEGMRSDVRREKDARMSMTATMSGIEQEQEQRAKMRELKEKEKVLNGWLFALRGLVIEVERQRESRRVSVLSLNED